MSGFDFGSLRDPDAPRPDSRHRDAVEARAHELRAKTRRNAIGHSAGPKRGRQHEQQSGHSADALNLAKNPQSERAVSGRPTWVLLTLCPDSAIIGAFTRRSVIRLLSFLHLSA